MAAVRTKRIVKRMIAAALIAGMSSPAFAFENALPALPGTEAMAENIEIIENTLPLGIPCPSLTDHAITEGPVSRWWRPGRDGNIPTQIVIHTTESDLEVGGAFNVASWLSRTDYRASAHFVVDVEETLITVDLEDTAWGVGGPQNNSGVQIELVGAASSTREDWLSPSAAYQLCRAAALTAQIAQVYDIPLRLLEAPGLLVGTAGVVGHYAYSEAFGLSTHTDPGPGFPWDAFLAQAASYLTEAAVVPQLPLDRIVSNKPSGPVSENDTKNEPLPELSELYRILDELEADISEEKLNSLGFTARNSETS